MKTFKIRTAMKKITYLFVTLAASLAVSCQIEGLEISTSENENPALTPMTFAISAPGTKTALDGGNVTWKTTDQISVFSCNDAEFTKAKVLDSPAAFSPDAAGSSTTISGEIEKSSADLYYAKYPYRSDDRFSINSATSRTFRVILPEKQSGSYEEMILLAVWDGSEFEFFHGTSLLKFTVPASLAGKLSKIKISSTVYLAGTIQINQSTRNCQLWSSETRYKDVYIEDAAGIAAGTYYLAVAPQNLSSGVTVETFGLTGEPYNSKSYDKSIDMRPAGSASNFGGRIVNLGTISEEAPAASHYPYPEATKTIEPIVNLFYATKGGTSGMSGTTNYTSLTDIKGIEFKSSTEDVEVPGSRIWVDGASSFVVCSSAADNTYNTYALVKGNTTDAPLPIYYSVPASGQDIYGDLEFSCSISQGGNLIDKITYAWSKDGSTWNDFDAVYCRHTPSPDQADGVKYSTHTSNDFSLNWAVCCFSIPESQKISEGGTLYIKATPTFKTGMAATSTLRINCGFMISNKVENTDFSGDSNVLASRNFDDCWYGFDAMVGKFTKYFVIQIGNKAQDTFTSGVADSYDWTPMGTFALRRGYVWAQTCKASAPAYYTSPALTGLTEPTDIVVTFKACINTDASNNPSNNQLEVAVDGRGTPGSLLFDSSLVPSGADPDAYQYQWHTCWAEIKGADATTKVKVGVVNPTTESRFYIDDIVISK